MNLNNKLSVNQIYILYNNHYNEWMYYWRFRIGGIVIIGLHNMKYKCGQKGMPNSVARSITPGCSAVGFSIKFNLNQDYSFG